MIERQELFCHECGMYVQFDLDLSLNGNHTLKCPNCDHEHCRVVKDGKITDIRWDSRNQQQWIVGYATYSQTSTYDTCSTASNYLYDSWMNTTSATAY